VGPGQRLAAPAPGPHGWQPAPRVPVLELVLAVQPLEVAVVGQTRLRRARSWSSQEYSFRLQRCASSQARTR
jgi:hypothetical protein